MRDGYIPTAEIIDSLKPDWRLFIPSAWRRERYRGDDLRADLAAAATVAMVSVPQALGFALLAGLPPTMVLGSVVVGGFVAALFFSCRHVIFGPSNSLSLLLAATFTAHHTANLGPAEMAILLAALIGIVQVAAGVFRFGQVTQFISRSVVIGYSAAIGLLLVFSQLPHLVGQKSSGVRELWRAPLEAVESIVRGQVNLWAAGTAVAAFLVFSLLKRLLPRSPDVLIGLVFFCVLNWLLKQHGLGVQGLGEIAAITSYLPDFSGLSFVFEDFATLRALIVPALALALLGMLESASIAKNYSIKTGDQPDTSRDLVGMGLGNLASACFGSMPGSASFARSAASFQAGGRTHYVGLWASLFVLVVVLVLAPLVNHLPIPALAAALIRVGWNLIDRDQIRIAARSTRSDALTLFGTFLAAMTLPLDIAIYMGVVLALFLALRKASTPTLAEYAFSPEGNLVQRMEGAPRNHPQIAIIHVEGELFFGAADLIQTRVRQQIEADDLRVVILRLKNARHMDATTVFALHGLHDYLRQTGRYLLVSGVHGGVLQVMKNSGLLERLGPENIFPADLNPNLATKRALERSRNLLAGAQPVVRLYYEQEARTGSAAVS